MILFNSTTDFLYELFILAKLSSILKKPFVFKLAAKFNAADKLLFS